MKKILAIIGIVLGLIFIGIGFFEKVPAEHLFWGTVDEYVGGDAYNYIIAAAMRGGRISGQMTSNAIYINSGTIIAIYSAFKLADALKRDKQDSIPAKNESSSDDLPDL